jgi:hypothetical protein
MRDEKTIQDMLDDARVRAFEPSVYPGMTYEQGVEAALEWALGLEDVSPLEEL